MHSSSNRKIIVHLTHGLYGQGNGVDTYISNFIENSTDKNIICTPIGENLSNHKALEIDDLHIIKEIVEEEKADILFLHWTGQETLKDKEDLILHQGKLISSKGNDFQKRMQLNYSPNSFVDVAMLFSDENRPKIFIINHCTYPIPKYIAGSVDRIIHVSQKAYEVNKKIQTNHHIIYPCFSKSLLEKSKVRKSEQSDKIRIGWLGRLNKYAAKTYDFLKEIYGNIGALEFIFAGAGELDETPPENFKFLGNVSPEILFNQIDIFLYPTSIDSFSIALLEAMLFALPCVVSEEVQELSQLGEGVTFSTYADLKSILELLILDESLRFQVGNSSKSAVKNKFSPENFIRQIEKVTRM